MTLNTSGNNSIITATENSLAQISSDSTIAETINNIITKIKSGKRILVNGKFIDETGNFFLFLSDNTTFAVNQNKNGTIRIGKRELINDVAVYSKGGNLIVHPTSTLGIHSNYLHYSFGNSNGTAKTGELSFYDSQLLFYTLPDNNRQDIYFSNICGSNIKGMQQGANATEKYIVLRMQDGGLFDDNVVSGINQFEFHGEPASLEHSKFTDLKNGFIAYSTGKLIKILHPSFFGTINNLCWTNNGGVHLVDPYYNGDEMLEAEIDSKNMKSQIAGNHDKYGLHLSKTHTEQLVDEHGHHVTAQVVYFRNVEDEIFNPSVDNNGIYTQEIKLKHTTNRLITYGKPVFKTHLPIEKATISYLYEIHYYKYDTYDSFRGIGTEVTPKHVLTTDPNITQRYMGLVTQYKGIDINYTTKTVTFTQDYDMNQAYDYFKYHKTLNISKPSFGKFLLTVTDKTIDFADFNIVIGPDVFLSKTEKFNTIKTTGTVTGKTDCLVQTTTVNSHLSFTNVDFWRLYDNEPARNINAKVIAAGKGDTAYRFAFTPRKTYYLDLQFAGEIFFKNVTPNKPGVTDVILNPDSITIKEIKKTEQISAKVFDLLQKLEDNTITLKKLRQNKLVTDTTQDNTSTRVQLISLYDDNNTSVIKQWKNVWDKTNGTTTITPLKL